LYKRRLPCLSSTGTVASDLGLKPDWSTEANGEHRPLAIQRIGDFTSTDSNRFVQSAPMHRGSSPHILASIASWYNQPEECSLFPASEGSVDCPRAAVLVSPQFGSSRSAGLAPIHRQSLRHTLP